MIVKCTACNTQFEPIIGDRAIYIDCHVCHRRYTKKVDSWESDRPLQIVESIQLSEVVNLFGLTEGGDQGWHGYHLDLPNGDDWPFDLILCNTNDDLPKDGDDLRVTLHGGEGCAADGSSLIAGEDIPAGIYQMEYLLYHLGRLRGKQLQLSDDAK